MTEVADSAEVALLVPRQDPLAIAAAVIRLHHDPDLRHRLAAAAFEQIRSRPGPGFRAQQTEEWYARLLGLSPARVD